MKPTPHHSRSGAALVIILAFMVMLLVLLLAFFSQSTLQQQISKSSASLVTADVFARGAAASIIGDLQQEIAAGSISTNVVTGTVTNTLYYPANSSNMVPSLSGNTNMTNAGLENLLKVSGTSPVFSVTGAAGTSNGPVRGSASTTTTASYNGRSISLARWNKPLLIARQSPASTTDFSPTNAFSAPQWILVARNGSNPTNWSSTMSWSPTNPATVIGRYAYVIYHEGGLLDANVAGYPTALTNATTAPGPYVPFKGGSFFADLTQIGLTANQITALVGWRNDASAQATGTFPTYTIPGNGINYATNVLANTNGFLITYNNSASGGTNSDRQFTSRQQLIEFLKAADSSGLTNALNALPYLGTFSRDLDQPSYSPATNRPKIVATYTTNTPYLGGNNQSGLEDLDNPSFLATRVATSFTRNDGSTAQVGEPLVKKRFALNRLAWLTYKGPSADLYASTPSDPVLQQYLSNGISLSLITNGTTNNISKYFGLNWDTTNHRWSYSHGDPGKGICCLPELVAGRVTSSLKTTGTITNAPREPDFFELIKASINVGSLGKASWANSTLTQGYEAMRDANVNEQIIQIGANLIDQFDPDGFPTRIRFAGATGGGHEFRGVEDLPYIYRVRTQVIQISLPDPNVGAPSTTTASALYDPTNNLIQVGTNWVTFNNTGMAASILMPELWNPHDASRPLPPSSLMPTEFHLTSDTTDPEGANTTYDTVSAVSRGNLYITNNGIVNTYLCKTDATNPYYFMTSPPYLPDYFLPSKAGSLRGSGPNQNNDIQFNVDPNYPGQFREPTALFIPGLPAGSNLKYGPKDWVIGGGKFRTNDPSLPLNTDKTAMLELGDASHPYIGICIGVAPLAWITTTNIPNTNNIKDLTNSYYVKINSGLTPWGGISRGFITHHLWYMDPFGTLQIYDEKYSGYVNGVQQANGIGWPQGTTQVGVAGTPRLDAAGGYSMVFNDPRTRRWGSGMLNGAYLSPILSYTTGIPSPVCVTWRNNQSDDGLVNLSALQINFPNTNSGWYPTTLNTNTAGVATGLMSQNNPAAVGTSGTLPAGWYTDPDGVTRRAMGGYVSTTTLPASTPIGLPNVVASVVDATTALCTPATNSTSYTPKYVSTFTVSPGQNLGRPIVLNRPFKNVGEMAYTFSDTPWKNLDLSTPESGNTALLDVFTINDKSGPQALVAGRVNLNTRQAPVVRALLAGGARDDAGLLINALTLSSVTNLANALVDHTTVTNPPLRNPAELVGSYVTGSGTNTVYHGYSELLTSIEAASPLGSSAYSIQRYRESPIRALSNVGSTRVWNLMIDLVAQTGRYPVSATSLDQFAVEGEKRYWLHIAIDRLTGKILDSQLEVVTE